MKMSMVVIESSHDHAHLFMFSAPERCVAICRTANVNGFQGRSPDKRLEGFGIVEKTKIRIKAP